MHKALSLLFPLALLPACTVGSQSSTANGVTALALRLNELPAGEYNLEGTGVDPDPQTLVLLVGNTQQTCASPLLVDAIDCAAAGSCACGSTVWQMRIHVPPAVAKVGDIDLPQAWTQISDSGPVGGGCVGGDGAGGNIDGTLTLDSIGASTITGAIQGVHMDQIEMPALFDPNVSFEATRCP